MTGLRFLAVLAVLAGGLFMAWPAFAQVGPIGSTGNSNPGIGSDSGYGSGGSAYNPDTSVRSLGSLGTNNGPSSGPASGGIGAVGRSGAGRGR